MSILRAADTQVLANALDAGAIAVMAGYFWGVLPQIVLLATAVWAVLRIWLIYEEIKFKRLQREQAANYYGRRKSDQ
jgi:hypothetical protein